MKIFITTSLSLLLLVANIACKKTASPVTDPNTVKDIEGNVYKTVKIGNQTWMTSDLRTTKYRNGDPIAHIPDGDIWITLINGAYQDPTFPNKLEYGNFYNWYAINDPRNIAPVGWHVATDSDFTELASFLGGNSIAGNKLKEAGFTHWNYTNAGTNESGFTALDGGFISGKYGGGITPGQSYFVWTSTLDPNTNYPIVYSIKFDKPEFNKLISNVIESNVEPKRHGCAVRCVKD
jgi:uncharacterized protein (TIGR02145 family)